MKKWLAMTSALVLLTSAGYGGVRAASISHSPAHSSVTLTYGFWDANQKPAMDQIEAAFTRTHPNIKIKDQVTPFAQYWTKLQTAATGGSMPDIVWMNGPNIDLYASNGILLPISSQVKSDQVNLGNYPKSLVTLYTYGGKLYAIPKDFDTIGLWYNKQLFRAAHVKFPDASWTWSTLMAAARKLTNKSKHVWGIAAQNANQEGYYNTIPQNGGFVISANHKKSGYDNPNTIGGLKFWIDMIKAGVSPTNAEMTETTPIDLFTSGKVAMLYGGSWNAVAFNANAYAKNRIDVAVLPKGKQRATVIHGLGYVISAKTSHPKEAWEFVKFLGSKEAALIQARTGTVIPAFNGTQQPWVKSMPQFHLKIFLDELAYAKPYPISKQTAKWNDLETTYFTKAWSMQMSIQAAAKQVATQMNQILAHE